MIVVAGQPRRLGGRIAPPDSRDLLASVVLTGGGRTYTPAPRADLRRWAPEIEDQGQLSDCTAEVACEMMALLYGRAGIRMRFSPLFTYWAERVLINARPPDEDAGSDIRSIFAALTKYGACPADAWPYDVSKYADRPSDLCFAEAANHKALRYYRLDSIEWMKAALTIGFPIAAGIAVAQNVMDQGTSTGRCLFPKPDEKILGYHAIMILGHDDEDDTCGDKGVFLWQSTWGRVGDGGYFKLPYRYFLDSSAPQGLMGFDPMTLHSEQGLPWS